MSELTKDIRTMTSDLRLPPSSGSDGSRPLSVSSRLGRLQFHLSGKFRVLQLADVQTGPKVSLDTIRLIRAAVESARPDVAVFTGNQIAGYDEAYEETFRKRRWSPSRAHGGPGAASRRAALDRTERLVRDTIAAFIAPLEELGVPWAVTYGNHDLQCGLDPDRMDVVYRGFPGCLNAAPDTVGSVRTASGRVRHPLPDQDVLVCEPGTFALPVSDVDHNRTVIGLALVDSGDYSRSGGYGSPSREALEFLAGLRPRIGGPSMVFQHFAVPQYYRLMREVPRTAAHAIEGYRAFAGRTFVLDESATLPGGYLGEGVSCPDVDSGEFDVIRRSGSCFAIACGHDHRNGFVGDADGITLMATPTCGFDSYGPAPSHVAARLLEFDIRHPDRPRTQLLQFGDLVGKSAGRKNYTYALNDVKSSSGETIDLLHRPGAFARLLHRLGLR